jgi:hypothetical protein
MTIQQMHDFFDLMLDKYNAPGYIAVEKDDFINRAQEELVNSIVFGDYLTNKQSPRGQAALYEIEDRVQSSEVIRPLIVADQNSFFASATNSNLLSYNTLDTIADTDETGTKFLHILRIRVSATNSGDYAAGKFVKFLRHNDLGRFYENSYKAPTVNKPYYVVAGDGLRSHPATGKTEQVIVSIIRSPRNVSLSGAVDSELPVNTHKRIVAIALELAGVALADAVLMQAPQL